MEEPYKEVFNLRVFGELPFEKIGAILAKVPVGPESLFTEGEKQIIAVHGVQKMKRSVVTLSEIYFRFM